MTTQSPEVSQLHSRWSRLESTFSDFVEPRKLDGTWKQIEQAVLKPEIPPELKDHVQGAFVMFAGLADDFRNLIAIHNMNPTRFNVHAAGNSEASKKVASAWKLCWAGWWNTRINRARWLDSYTYEGQISLGISIVWWRWSGNEKCPVYAEKVLPECIRWQGDFLNPP